jgi:phosphoglycerate dehydrogenase-like enzyme
MKLLIVLSHRFDLWNAPDWFAEKLRAEFPQLEIVHLKSYDRAAEELRDAEIAIAWSLRPEQFKAATRLRWIHAPAAAVHQLMFPELVESDIVLTNARSVHGPVVAEHVIAQIFALAKKIPAAVRLQQKHIWGQSVLWEEKPGPREVAGATLGIVGLGSIGSQVAVRAKALGMRILAVREHPEKGSGPADRVFGPAQLDELLAEADYVVLAAPLTGETSFLMNASRLGKMKADACLINVSRGPLVDEAALADALRHRRLAGAALDVFSREPLAPQSPLWDLENLLITPHTAAVTGQIWQRHYALMRENLSRYLQGRPLLAVVDKRKGY